MTTFRIYKANDSIHPAPHTIVSISIAWQSLLEDYIP